MPITGMSARHLADEPLATSGAPLVLAEWTAEASVGGELLLQAPPHKHPEAEAWYVLEGMLRIRAGEQVHEVSKGGAVVIPGGTAHTFWNPQPVPARYLLIMGTQTFALIQAIHAAQDRGQAAMRALYASHGATLLE
ncbi:MAG: cupin domain-containing protein [Candidatus Dormibacteria bacterium]